MAEEKLTEEVATQKVPPSAQLPNAPLRDQRTQPPGVVAKQSQSYLIVGLSVVILLAVLFSKNHAKPVAKPLPAASTSTEANAEASQRNVTRFEEDLTAKQRQVEAQRQAAADTNLPASEPNGTATANMQRPPDNRPPRDPIADAEKALAFKSRFASNLVSPIVTRSHDNMARSPWQRNPGTSMGGENASAQTLPQPRMDTSGTALPRNADSSATSAANGKRAPEVNLNSAHGQPYVLFEGTILDTALLNRLVGDFAGPVKVMVTNPVYSHDRQHVLIPAGTFLLGDVQKVSGFGQRRLAVRFHRMLMPDGYSVDLDQFHGLDQAGATGLSDQVNNHYVQIFGASIALGVISGAAEATMYGSGYNISGPAMYEQGVASSLSQSGADVLDRFINILPTITIREGHRIKVYLTQDMLLPAYENHTMPGDF